MDYLSLNNGNLSHLNISTLFAVEGFAFYAEFSENKFNNWNQLFWFNSTEFRENKYSSGFECRLFFNIH